METDINCVGGCSRWHRRGRGRQGETDRDSVGEQGEKIQKLFKKRAFKLWLSVNVDGISYGTVARDLCCGLSYASFIEATVGNKGIKQARKITMMANIITVSLIYIKIKKKKLKRRKNDEKEEREQFPLPPD